MGPYILPRYWGDAYEDCRECHVEAVNKNREPFPHLGDTPAADSDAVSDDGSDGVAEGTHAHYAHGIHDAPTRRTRRTDAMLVLRLAARRACRAHLGGGGTRLEHAQQPFGDG